MRISPAAYNNRACEWFAHHRLSNLYLFSRFHKSMGRFFPISFISLFFMSLFYQKGGKPHPQK
ncbi:hypothetical protein GT23_1409 [Parageobacillus thermoglucosidasius]|nr:hypothetical protein GT23_1409 [Parageobacillus thermoglucosidasius]